MAKVFCGACRLAMPKASVALLRGLSQSPSSLNGGREAARFLRTIAAKCAFIATKAYTGATRLAENHHARY